MSGRRKQTRGASSSTSVNYDASRFFDEKAEEQYRRFLTRSIVKERGFDLGGPNTEIGNMLTDRHWEEFGKQPQDAVVSLVREFYANLKVRYYQLTVFVRGKMVGFDAHTINSLYGFPEVMDDDYEEEIYNDILQTICKQGAEWRMRDNVHVSLAKSDLTEVAKHWYSFICARIKPTEHTTTVIKERATLIYGIMTGKEIDLGLMLQHSILDFARGNSPSGLLHPSLITDLCRNAGVTWAPNEEVLKPKNPIVVVQPLPGGRMNARARREDREFNQRAHERRAQAQAEEQQPHQRNRRNRLAQLEEDLRNQQEEMRQQRQNMEEYRLRNDMFMGYMMDFTSVLAQQFPAASTSGNPFPQPPQWPPNYHPPEQPQQPPPQQEEDDDDGNDY